MPKKLTFDASTATRERLVEVETMTTRDGGFEVVQKVSERPIVGKNAPKQPRWHSTIQVFVVPADKVAEYKALFA